MAHPESRFEPDYRRVNLSPHAKQLLDDVKRELEQGKGRQVTMSETVEELAAHWRATERRPTDEPGAARLRSADGETGR